MHAFKHLCTAAGRTTQRSAVCAPSQRAACLPGPPSTAPGGAPPIQVCVADDKVQRRLVAALPQPNQPHRHVPAKELCPNKDICPQFTLPCLFLLMSHRARMPTASPGPWYREAAQHACPADAHRPGPQKLAREIHGWRAHVQRLWRSPFAPRYLGGRGRPHTCGVPKNRSQGHAAVSLKCLGGACQRQA
jgi:hypothetical protein